MQGREKSLLQSLQSPGGTLHRVSPSSIVLGASRCWDSWAFWDANRPALFRFFFHYIRLQFSCLRISYPSSYFLPCKNSLKYLVSCLLFSASLLIPFIFLCFIYFSRVLSFLIYSSKYPSLNRRRKKVHLLYRRIFYNSRASCGLLHSHHIPWLKDFGKTDYFLLVISLHIFICDKDFLHCDPQKILYSLHLLPGSA